MVARLLPTNDISEAHNKSYKNYPQYSERAQHNSISHTWSIQFLKKKSPAIIVFVGLSNGAAYISGQPVSSKRRTSPAAYFQKLCRPALLTWHWYCDITNVTWHCHMKMSHDSMTQVCDISNLTLCIAVHHLRVFIRDASKLNSPKGFKITTVKKTTDRIGPRKCF